MQKRAKQVSYDIVVNKWLTTLAILYGGYDLKYRAWTVQNNFQEQHQRFNQQQYEKIRRFLRRC